MKRIKRCCTIYKQPSKDIKLLPGNLILMEWKRVFPFRYYTNNDALTSLCMLDGFSP